MFNKGKHSKITAAMPGICDSAAGLNKTRIWTIIWVSTGLLCMSLTRMAYLQIWDGPGSGSALAAKALKVRSQTIPGEEFYRGEILDRNLLSLTDSGVRPTLVAFPSGIEDIELTALRLKELIELEPEYTESLIKRGQGNYGARTPVVLKVNITDQQVEKLKACKIPGIAVLPLKTRYGPGSVAKHLIGHLNSIDDNKWQKLSQEKRTIETNPNLATAYKVIDKVGVAGLEAKYENALRGGAAESHILAIGDANGRLLQGLGYKIQEEPVDSWRNHLVLTLDRRHQEIVEEVLGKYLTRGAAVVIDVETGDVLAAASRPDFDQNQVSKYLAGVDELIDRTERVAFYPGSVFKMVVAAAVLEEKLVEPNEVFICTGTHAFSDGTEIKCLQEHGQIDLQEAINKSCNMTFVQLGLRLGNAKLAEYASKLGFIININSVSPPALIGNASIGQEGVLVSPMQIANLYATLARDGLYHPCRLVSDIRSHQGDIIQDYPRQAPEQVISAETSRILKEALARTAKNGTGRMAWIEDYGTAGKTGTAQANDAKKVIAWFAGYTPVENPRLAIAVMVEENRSGSQTGLRGGDIAAPIFKEIGKRILDLEQES